MTYDPMQIALAKSNVIGQTSESVGMAIQDVAQKIPELIKRGNIKTELNQAYVDILENFADKAIEADPSIDRQKAMIEGMKFYRKPMQDADPELSIKLLLNGDVGAEKYIEDLKVKKFRSESGKPISTEGPAGPGYQPPGTPMVNTAGNRGLPEIQRDALNESLRQPRTTVPETPADMYARGQAAGITEKPEFKSDLQKQQDIEAGLLYQSGQGKGTYLSEAATSGVDPSTGAASALGGTLMTEKDIATNERLTKAAEQRNAALAERNRINGWRVALQQRKLTSDERRDILQSQSKNEVERLKLEIKIKQLQTDLKTKAGKTDPTTFRPILNEQETESMYNELEALQANLGELQDIGEDYRGLLVEKGGTVTNPQKPTSGIPRFSSPNDPGFRSLPSGSKFIDSNGVTRIKK